MKAVVYYEHGGPEVLEIADLPEPKPGPNDVVLAVEAAALNHLDVWVRRGLPNLKLDMPHVPGSDVAGVVAKLGSRVRGYRVGDRVTVNPGLSCGKCEFCRRGQESLCVDFKIIGEHVQGTCAEFVKVPARNLFRIPSKMRFEEAAAAPLTFLTAWRMLATRAGLKRGQDVLVHGAGSGVTIAAIQIAKHVGARVFVTSRDDGKLRRARQLGADVLINTTRERFDEVVWRETGKRGVDVVLDHVGPATWPQNLRSLTRDGKMVVCGATSGPTAQVDIRSLYWRQVSIIGSTMSSQKEFRDVMSLVVKKRLTPIIHEVMPMSRARKAHEILERGQQFGKIVLVPQWK